ncbi:acyl-ACP thioesterase domain-containing protein [Geotalea sp. SG265]|uniref:acyl-[acyl-carrier-protein] thioesterase n=1 Tax=Geotalea sp. SG265 TaxID=2922867 RepID=UPI001FAFAF36|nr:acyl-ACP thioesterase domain-containing protein [Geotalea sp. SG265]
MEDSFEHALRIRSYEVDCTGSVKPAALFNFLQDAAVSHVKQLGLSVSDLRKMNLTWVISRFHLRLFHYLRSNARITVRTWPSTCEGFFSCREYEILDDAGTVIALATSSWAAVNLDSRRPVRLKDHLPDFPLRPERAIEDSFPSLPAPCTIDHEQRFRVRRSDLDINCHVNHAVYVDWMVETVPAHITAGYRLAEIEVGFRGEALYGDKLVCRCGIVSVTPEYVQCTHQLVNEANGKELTRFRSVWRPLTIAGGETGGGNVG